MVDLSYDFIITLQKEVLRKFGAEVILPADCKHLSHAILDTTTKLVSETTLKRVFGFAVAQHSFSRYTLNTLSQYCAYKDWEDFQQRHHQQAGGAPATENNKWNTLKAKADAVSHYTLLTLKNRSGVPFQQTAARQYCFAHVERFLESDYAATALIAPSGWGKSIALVHVAEHFWFGREGRYKQDVCWFIHAHAAGSLLLKGFSLSTWLDNQLNLGAGENLREYFAQHYKDKGGRLVLIIDGFDEMSVAGDKLRMLYSKLEDFVYSNDRYPWVKVILSIRSSTWSDIFQHSQQYPAFRRYWYLGQEMEEETNINLPPLTEQEVKTVLHNYLFDPAIIRTFSEQFLQRLRYPYYLQIFCQLNADAEKHFVDEHLSLYEIISKFIQQRLFNSPSNSLKIRIIEKMLSLLDLGRNGIYTDKGLLLNQNADLFPAYKELLADNILVEENLSQEIMFYVKVRFAHNMLLEYFTAMKYLQDSQQQITQCLVHQVLEHLPQSPYRVGVFQWLLRFAINQHNVQGIRCIFQGNFTAPEKSQLLESLALHYQHEGKGSNELKAIFPPSYFQQYPVKHYVSDDIFQFRNRSVLHVLLTLVESPEDKLRIRFILFMNALVGLHAEQCEVELLQLKKLFATELRDDVCWVSPYEIALFFYDYLKFGIVDEDVRTRIYQFSNYWSYATQPLTFCQQIVYRSLSCIFSMLGDYETQHRYAQELFTHVPWLRFHKSDPFRVLVLCRQAEACLNLGDISGAERLCRHAEQVVKQYPTEFIYSRYPEMLQKVMQGAVLYAKKEYPRSLRQAEQAMEHLHKLDFKTLAIANYHLLDKLYHHLKMGHQQYEVQQQLELIRKSTSFKHEQVRI
ncbi:hypothetical protein DCC81_04370 [Chitinophaga parva]|uniref:NACHT domain-containing protein n=1 Tax=Chitinophaga parva TaxID=2169414 RepID=A0A2T7BM40_9BACT|nr:hypothetical protein [Chitinophaga parva]PUZ28726.1 hypothetical protein DCC81_04370 [Chitinophaga parva]